MKLFSIINDNVPENGTVIIVVSKTGDKLTASIALRNDAVKDTAKDYIQPLALCGTPQELDENFEKEIVKPMESSAGLQTTMQEYENAQKVAEANSKARSDEKKKKAETARKTAAAQATALNAAKKLMDDKKWSEAAAKYREILANDSLGLNDNQKNSVNKLLEVCESRDGGLFVGSDIDDTEMEVIQAQAADGITPDGDDASDEGAENEDNEETE